MTFQLRLAGDQRQVVLSRKTSRLLQTHQKNALRFVFHSYVKKQPGAILTVDLHMNHEHTCAVALSALYKYAFKNLPSVILCNDSRYWFWFDFMKRFSELDVFRLTGNNAERLLSRNEAMVLIVTDKEHAILRGYVKDYQFFVLIVDEIDVLCEKLITKQVQADFHLGFTHRHFVIDPDQQLRWKIVNWALKKTNKQLAKLPDFKEYDDAYRKIFVDPYTEFWETFAWDLCTEAEIAQNKEQRCKLLENIARCVEAHDKPNPDKTNPKRKRDANSATQKECTEKGSRKTQKKRATTPIDEYLEHWSSDEETRPDFSVFEVSITSSTEKSPLRLKSPKKKNVCDVSQSETIERTFGRRLDFDDADTSAPKNSSTIKRTQSCKLILDPVVIDEFSKPFDIATTSCKLQTSKSDSALLTSKVVKEESNVEEFDVAVLQEFSHAFEPKIADPNTMHGLFTEASNDSETEELNLYLSDTNEDENNVNNSQQPPAGNCMGVNNISSDEDLDAYIAEFLTVKSLALSKSPESTEKFFSGRPRQQKVESSDEDTEYFLRGVLSSKCQPNLENESRNEIKSAESSEGESFLLAFL